MGEFVIACVFVAVVHAGLSVYFVFCLTCVPFLVALHVFVSLEALL